MKRKNRFLMGVFLIVFCISCEDIFEEDITDKALTVESPLDQSTILGNTVQFRWSELEGVTQYKLQVKEDSSNIIILDSTVTETSLTYGLNEGEYNWRVRGENSVYNTGYTVDTFFSMLSNEDLSNQTVFLSSPSSDFYTNNSSIILSWGKLTVANSYSIAIDKTLQNNTVTVFQINDLTDNFHTIDETILDEDAIYTWKVSAVNDDSQTNFFSREIFYDTQVPNQPSLSLPSNGDVVENEVEFSWSIASDSGEVKSNVYSVIEIASDTAFTNIINSITVSAFFENITFSDEGTYYWRVKSIDEAGNESGTSEVRSVTIQ